MRRTRVRLNSPACVSLAVSLDCVRQPCLFCLVLHRMTEPAVSFSLSTDTDQTNAESDHRDFILTLSLLVGLLYTRFCSWGAHYYYSQMQPDSKKISLTDNDSENYLMIQCIKTRIHKGAQKPLRFFFFLRKISKANIFRFTVFASTRICQRVLIVGDNFILAQIQAMTVASYYHLL